jgi:hypothetical protein
MAGFSKNSNTGKKEKTVFKMVTSSTCESCESQCDKGIQYLSVFKVKKSGNGVVCKKV